MACLRTTLSLAIASAALAAASGARAAAFDVVTSSPDMVTLVDPAAVEAIGDGKVRRAWSVNVQRNLVSGGPQQPGYVRTQNDYDCQAWKIRWRGFSVYSRFGDLVMHKDNDDPAWAPIEGNFEATASARIICDGRAAGSVYTASSIGQLVVTLMQAWDAAAPMPPLQPVEPIARTPAPKRRAKR
ncbi:MAG TPA: surface-adhesin E family protein [Phenylobacterium sp.]|jgi:hypothetical protein|nr:surface-adhesin E family protein [Phenylobacterium sp.]